MSIGSFEVDGRKATIKDGKKISAGTVFDPTPTKTN